MGTEGAPQSRIAKCERCGNVTTVQVTNGEVLRVNKKRCPCEKSALILLDAADLEDLG